MIYKISRYWNRMAYFFIHLGWKLIWDQTGKNSDLLNRDDFSGDFASKYSEAIFCDRK